MDVLFDWKRTIGDLQGPVVQQFDEPTSLQFDNPEANVVFSNVEPGKAYTVYEIFTKNNDGDLWTDGFSSNIQLFKRNLFWPVSNIDALPFTRDEIVSNIDFDLHHTKIRTYNMAMRVTTRPESKNLFDLNGNFDCSFIMFLDSNVDTDHHFTVSMNNDDGVYVFTPNLPSYIELHHVYVFDNSDNHEDHPIQLIDMNNNILVHSDEYGILTVALDTDLHAGLIGQQLALQDGNNPLTNVTANMSVRDGSLRRLYREFPPIEFGNLFTPHFNTFIYEFPNIDTSYTAYDVSMSIVVRDKANTESPDYYVTSHQYTHTIQTDSDYPPPTTIEITNFRKTSPDSVRFEFPSDYFIGLKFGLESNVSLMDMYSAYLFGNNQVEHLPM